MPYRQTFQILCKRVEGGIVCGKQKSGDFLLPMRMSEDLKAVEIEEWTGFVEQIAEQSIYEVLILDIDEGIRGVYELLRMCTEIHVAVIKEEVAQAKLFQFEEELHLMGYDDVKQKMVKKELEG